MATGTCLDFPDFRRDAIDGPSGIDPATLARVFDLVKASALPALQAEIDAYHIARAGKRQADWQARNPGKPLSEFWGEGMAW